ATSKKIPDDAIIAGNQLLVKQLFALNKSAVHWSEIVAGSEALADPERLFWAKWLNEVNSVVYGASTGSSLPQQTILPPREGGSRYRLLLYHVCVRADETLCCDFLAIPEVAGPLNLPRPLLAVVTYIRMGFRFRYEIIKRLQDIDPARLSEQERRER